MERGIEKREMNIINKPTAFCIILLLLPITLAISQETSTVARIIGDTPQEMISQLDTGSIFLDSASVYSDEKFIPESMGGGRAADLNRTISAEFPKASMNFQTIGSAHGTDWWRWDDVQKSRSGLLIIESKGSVEDGKVISKSPDWFDKAEPPINLESKLVVFDSSYAGASLPKQGSFVKPVMVAPTAFAERNFVNSFACALENDNLGEIYRNARNNYYWERGAGVGLMSYHLYGNPLSNITLPGSSDCEELNANEKILSGSLYYNIELNLESYSVANEGNFSLLLVNNTALNYEYDGMVLPYAVKTTEFPLGTIIENFSYSFFAPMDIPLSKLPSWQGDLVDRICLDDKQDAQISFSMSYGEDKEFVTAAISPVEVVDCTEGRFRLWRGINYSIKYQPYSPVMISSIEHPKSALPDSAINISVLLKKITLENMTNGTLSILSQDKIAAEKDISLARPEQSFGLEMRSSFQEGIAEYELRFSQGNESKTSARFSIETQRVGLNMVMMPDGANLEINSEINVTVYDYLVHDGQVLQSGSRQAFGNSVLTYSYQGLRKEDASYNVILDVMHSGNKRALSGQIITNHPPALGLIKDITIGHAELAIIRANAFDEDNDSLEYSINDSRFSQESTLFSWRGYPTGIYAVEVMVTDGISSDSQVVKINVTEGCHPNWTANFSECEKDDKQYVTWHDNNSCGKAFLDYNDDGIVGMDELSFIRACFDKPFEDECLKADLNHDGRLSIIDLTAARGLFGYPNSSFWTFIGCNYCNSTWININSTCRADDSFTFEYSYTNNCCADTGLPSDCNIPLNGTGWCDYCTPRMTNSSWSDWYNSTNCLSTDTLTQARTRLQFDANNCGELANVTFIEYGDTTCNYCTPSWYSYNSSCETVFVYNNSCCLDTGLASDCSKPKDTTCTHSFNISLKKGWNLVSLPLKSENPLQSIAGKFSRILGFSEGKWIDIDQPNETIGFWIKMEEDAVLAIVGQRVTNISYHAGGIAGYPRLDESNASDMFNASIYSYNGTWQSYVPGRQRNSLEKLRPGYGYWVFGI